MVKSIVESRKSKDTPPAPLTKGREVERLVLRVERWLVALCLCVLTGCEVIGDNERLIAVQLPVDSAGRNHVLIEFTGFRCVNCPKAATVADKLHHTYGERLITVAMHPASNPFTRGADKYDYTCPAADTYYLYMGGNATTPFPTGNIDMLAYDHDYLVDYSMWATLLAERMGEPASVQLAASALLKPASRQLTVRTRCFAIDKQDLQVAVWLVEDSIIGAQALPDGTVDTQYCHNYVLRAALSAEWGEPVTAQPQPEELIFDTALPEGCDARHCSVVVVAMDQNKSIINAKQIKIE